MDILIAVLRVLHIVFGVFLVGNALFLALVLEPRLRPLDASVRGPVMGALMPVLTVIQAVNSAIAITTGIALGLILRWGNLGTFFTTGWGWSISIGFVATVTAVVIAFGFMTPPGNASRPWVRA